MAEHMSAADERKRRKKLAKRCKKGLSPCFEKRFIHFVCSQIENPLIAERVYYLLTWYNDKAEEHKNSYNVIRTLIYFLPGVITVVGLASSLFEDFAKYALIFMSLISATITFLNHRMDHRRYYENWVRYRGAAEDIKKECMQFLNRCGDYENLETPAAERLFANRIEGVAEKECDNWKNLLDDSYQGYKNESAAQQNGNSGQPNGNVGQLNANAGQPNEAGIPNGNGEGTARTPGNEAGTGGKTRKTVNGTDSAGRK